jgi:glycosyltransferase involved in cell wall biosynthesis
MKIAFITHYCTHYRVKTYETLDRYADVDYYFYSQGNEWYWLQEHGVQEGNFHFEYLPGFRVGTTKISPTLPFRLVQKDYDAYIKCINGKFVLPLTYLIAHLRKKPFILWTGIWMRLQTPIHRLVFPLTRYFYTHADAIVTYGEHVRQFLLELGVADERIFVTKHAVDNELYSKDVSPTELAKLRRKLDISSNQKVVLYLGRLVPEKGLDFLIEAFARLDRDDTALVIVGTGSERQRLEKLVKKKSLDDQIRFTGYVAPQKTVLYYALAYVYVLPSITTERFKEPWGLVVNEAFNQGVPVIATDAVGAAAGGLLQNKKEGFIVPEQDSITLSNKLEEILDNPEQRKVFSQNARRKITTWTNEEMVSGFIDAISYTLD